MMEDDNTDDLCDAEGSLFTRVYSSILCFFFLYKKYIVFLALIGVGYFAVTRDFSSVLEDAVTPKLKKGTYWDADYAQKVLSKSNKPLKAAIKDLNDQRFDEAMESILRVDSELGAYLRQFKNQSFSDQETFWDRYQQQLAPLQNTILSLTDQEFSKMRAGGPATAVYDVLRLDFHPILNEAQQVQLRADFDAVDRARAQLALRWVRIESEPTHSEYLSLIKSRIRQAWEPDYGFELVFGKALGPKERRATWSRYTLGCEEVVEEYKWSVTDKTDLKQALLSSATIPVGIQAYLQVSDSVYPSNWDKLTILNIMNSAPERLDVSGNTLKAIVSVGQLEEKYREQLTQQVEISMDLPDFEIQLNRNGAKTLATRSGVALTDAGALRESALQDREAFIAQSQQWLNDPSFEQSEEILLVYLELNLTQCADVLIAKLPSLDRPAAQRVASYLQTKLWWGDYRAAFELSKNSYYPISIDMLEALAADYREPLIREYLLASLSQADKSSYQTLAKLVVKHCPKQDLILLKPYLPVIEDSVAQVLFSAIYTRNEDLAIAWMLELLPEMPPRVQRLMIKRHHLNGWKQPSLPAMLECYKTVYQQATVAQFEDGGNRVLTELILDRVKPLLHMAEVYEFVQSLDLTHASMPLQIEFAREFFQHYKGPRDAVYYAYCYEQLVRYADLESTLYSSGEFSIETSVKPKNQPKIAEALLAKIWSWSDLSESLQQQTLVFFAERAEDPYLVAVFLRQLARNEQRWGGHHCEWDWTDERMVQLLEAGYRDPSLRYKIDRRIAAFPPETQALYPAIIAEGVGPKIGDEHIR